MKKENNGKPYVTTLRIYSDEDKKQVKSLKKEFNCSSLSKCVILVSNEYFRIKKELQKIHDVLEKSVNIKYEIPENVVNNILHKENF